MADMVQYMAPNMTKDMAQDITKDMAFEQTLRGLCCRLKVYSSLGLHARPAARIAEAAQIFQASLHVECGKNSADGKSMLDILTLGAVAGSELVFYAQGEDAEACLTRIAELFFTGFKE